MPDISRRNLAASLAALAAAPAIGVLPARSALAAPAPAPLGMFDPELRPAVGRIQAMAGSFPPLSAETLPAVRKATEGFAEPLLPQPASERRLIPGLAGAPEVPVYVVGVQAGSARPAILHTHGGGFVTGSPKIDQRHLQNISLAADCVVVSVDYRLAPEITYAGSTADAYAGLLWLYRHASELGVDRSRIAVMGESAGGGHAALLAIRARDLGEVPLVLQVLVYPMLDDRTGSSRPTPAGLGLIAWTAEQNRFGWRAFLGQAPGGADVPAAAVPARTANLGGLPPAFIGVGALDLFVDEDIDYARRLIDAGVATELMVIPGAFHGFDAIAPEAGVSKRFSEAKITALRRAFAASPKAA